ncbi:hypothetical protein DMP15_04735 [Pseudonocardia sp. UM4_GMWB1]
MPTRRPPPTCTTRTGDALTGPVLPVAVLTAVAGPPALPIPVDGGTIDVPGNDAPGDPAAGPATGLDTATGRRRHAR